MVTRFLRYSSLLAVVLVLSTCSKGGSKAPTGPSQPRITPTGILLATVSTNVSLPRLGPGAIFHVTTSSGDTATVAFGDSLCEPVGVVRSGTTLFVSEAAGHNQPGCSGPASVGCGAVIKVDLSTHLQVAMTDSSISSGRDVEWSPAGAVLLILVHSSTFPSTIYELDPATRAMHAVWSSPDADLVDLAVQPNGSIYALGTFPVNGQYLGGVMRVDLAGGGFQVVTHGSDIYDPTGIAVMPGGDLVVANILQNGDHDVIRVNASTGQQTVIWTGVAGGGPVAVGDNGYVYATVGSAIYVLDPATGASRAIAQVGGTGLGLLTSLRWLPN